MRANLVRFTPGARTAWHSHALGQPLYIVEGIALVHGAAPDRFMIHLALRETADATWLEHVADDNYHNPRFGTRARP